MPGESLSFDITARDSASSSFRSVGNAAADASVKMDLAAASAKLWNDTSTRQVKANDTLIASKLAVAKADTALQRAENFVSTEADKATKILSGQGRVLDDTAQKATSAASGFSALAGGGGLQGGGMAALIGAGVALSPVLLTLGLGLTGLAAAAYGIAKPIENAAQKTGGLAKNLGSLNPEQQQAATGLLNLGKQFSSFQNALQPEVLGLFDKGLQLAGTVMHGIEPIAAATGNALGTLLSQIDAEFKSGAWQSFFAFMARTAAPDVQLLGSTFLNLTATLPPLLQLLQPVATDVLGLAAGMTKLVQVSASSGQSLDSTGQHMNALEKVTAGLRTVLFAPGVGLLDGLKVLHIVGSGAGDGLQHTAAGAASAKPPVFNLAAAVSALNTSMTTLVGNLLTLQGDNLAWKQSMLAAEKQLESNTAGLAGNSKNALANKQAILASTNAAIQFASQQLTLGKDIGHASDTIQAQIRFLQGLHDKSAFVRSELSALRQEEARLNAQRINQRVNVTGDGTWSIAGVAGKTTIAPRAAGGLIPGSGNGDTVPALLTPGEVVVPKPMVGAGAVDHLRGRLPGFAAGGIVPSYAGNVAGIAPWIRGNDTATIRLIDQAVVSATLAGIRSAASSFAGVGGGVARWAPLVLQVLGLLRQPSSDLGVVLSQMTTESGGNPYAINLTDSNAAAGDPSRGLMQVIGSTFAAYAGPFRGLGIYNPEANIYAGLNYAINRYGSGWTSVLGHGHGYDSGGWLPTGTSIAVNNTGRPERVLAGGGGGNTYNISVMVPVSANKADTGRQVVEAIREFERRSGNGWRS